MPVHRCIGTFPPLTFCSLDLRSGETIAWSVECNLSSCFKNSPVVAGTFSRLPHHQSRTSQCYRGRQGWPTKFGTKPRPNHGHLSVCNLQATLSSCRADGCAPTSYTSSFFYFFLFGSLTAILTKGHATLNLVESIGFAVEWGGVEALP